MSEHEPPHEPVRYGGSIERTLSGRADLEVGAVLREAWARIDGIKAIVVGGMLLVYAVVVLVTVVVTALFGPASESYLGNALGQLAVMIVVYPFLAGVFMLGLRRSVGLPVRFEDQFSYYRNLWPVVAVGALQSLVTLLGLMLLVVPGIYLAIALSLAVPLKAERDLPIADCLITSLRVVNRKFLEVTIITLAAAGVTFLGVLSLIGWIWTVPWTLMMLAILYRQLVGFTPDGPPPMTGRLEV